MVSYIDLSHRYIYFFINKKSIYLLLMESIPYDKRSGKIWFNGKTVDWADANIKSKYIDFLFIKKYIYRWDKSI